MKTFTVYLNTNTGRSQVTVEADRFELTDKGFDFFRDDRRVAFFVNTHCFGLVEEQPTQAWEEEPPPGPV